MDTTSSELVNKKSPRRGRINMDYHLKCLGAYGAFHQAKEEYEAGRWSKEQTIARLELLLEGLRALEGKQFLPDKPTPQELAWLVWQKTNGVCSYCDCDLNPFDRMAPDGFHIEHETPKCQGGTDDIENLVPACRECNFEKAGRTPDQWLVAKNGGRFPI